MVVRSPLEKFWDPIGIKGKDKTRGIRNKEQAGDYRLGRAGTVSSRTFEWVPLMAARCSLLCNLLRRSACCNLRSQRLQSS